MIIKNIYILRLCTILPIIFVLTSCGGKLDEIKQIGKEPKLSRIDPPVMWAENPELHVEKSANSLWQPGSRAFFRDSRARRVGDILKVKITIQDKAKLNNQTKSSRSSKEDMGLNGLFGAQTQLDKFIEMPSGAPLVGTTGGNNNQGGGSIDRKEDIQTEIAAMVKQILPNGNLVIEGNQEVRINFELRELSVAGIIRPEDISASNTVNADQIAEARISYGGKGTISRVQQPRYGSQFLDIILPW